MMQLGKTDVCVLVVQGGARTLSEHCQNIHAQGSDPPNVQVGTYNKLATDSGV